MYREQRSSYVNWNVNKLFVYSAGILTSLTLCLVYLRAFVYHLEISATSSAVCKNTKALIKSKLKYRVSLCQSPTQSADQTAHPPPLPNSNLL